MKLVASDSDVGAPHSVAKGDVTYATPKTVEMIKQLQRLDHHGSTATQGEEEKEGRKEEKEGGRETVSAGV